MHYFLSGKNGNNMIMLGIIGLVVAVGLVYMGFNGDSNLTCFLGILCGGMVGLCSITHILYVMGMVR